MQTLWLQGRAVAPEQVDWIRGLICGHPEWGRTQLSIHIAEQWNWRNAAGRLKDMAARTLLLKLEDRQLLRLPARQQCRGGSRPALVPRTDQLHLWEEGLIGEPLRQLRPIKVKPVDGLPEGRLLARLLSQYHYLGYRRSVGENLQYLAWDRSGRVLACAVFGAAAWKCAARDRYVGWNPSSRQSNLFLVANNMRLLILPWVRVKHLASHLLGLLAGRLSSDWENKYGHRIYLLESFVDRSRFLGSCYRAANWICAGQTQGRSRNDRARLLSVPCKDVYVFPLTRQFRPVLQSLPPGVNLHGSKPVF
jgi:hypothetical protein